MREAAEAGAGMFSDRMIERAKEVDDQLKLAHQRLDRELKPSWEGLANTMLSIRESWAWIIDNVATFVQWVNRIELSGLKSELAELNAIIEQGANRGWPYSGTPIEDITARRDQVQQMIDDRSGPSRRARVVVTPSRGSGAAPTRRAETESRDRFDSAVDSITRRTAALEGETAAIDLGTAARERSKIVAELETVAKQANAAAGRDANLVTEEQRQKIDAVADSWARASAAIENARNPLASYARESANLTAQLQSFAVQGLGSVENQFVGVIKGTTDLKSAFRNLIDSMIEDLARLALRQAILAPIASGINSMFGGGGSIFGGAGFAGSAIGAGGVNTLPFGGPRAAGGPISPNTAYLVGELGPEIVVPRTAGTVIPNSGAAGGINQTNNINVTVNGNGGSDPKGNEEFAKQISKQIRVEMEGVATAAIRRQMRPGGMLKP
jgi:hypothetical protein